MEFFVGRNLVRRWKREVRESHGHVIVLSPYVTSRTAETVLLDHCAESHPRLYTSFDPMLFTSGSSSLLTLGRLARAGCRIFHVPDLHAKIVLVPGVFCSIGSQNLTAGGTRRREASAAWTDASQVNEVHDLIRPWLDMATPVSPAMIEQLIKVIGPLERKWRRVGRKIASTNESFLGILAPKRELDQKARRRRLLRLAAVTDDHTAASPTKLAKVTSVASGEFGLHKISTLLAKEENLLDWRLNGRSVRLSKTRRYLLFVPSTGQLAWARVMKTRISRFHDNIAWRREQSLFGHSYELTFRALDPQRGPGNLRIELDRGALIIDTWFTPRGLEYLSHSQESIAPAISEFRQRLKPEWATVDRSLSARLLEPFKYTANLSGQDAASFLGDSGEPWCLRLGTLASHSSGMYLVAER